MMLAFPNALFAKAVGVEIPPGPLDPVSLFSGQAGGYWNFDDLASLRVARDGTGATPGVGDPVGWAQDKSGNGNHLAPGNDSWRPTAAANGIIIDGVDDSMAKAFAASVAQPFEVMVCLEQLAYGGEYKRIFGDLAGAPLALMQGPTSGSVRFADGVEGTVVNPGLAVETVIDGYFNAGSGSVAINDGAMQSSPGTGQSFSGLLIGTDPSGASRTNVRFKHLLVIGRALSAAERDGVRLWMRSQT